MLDHTRAASLSISAVAGLALFALFALRACHQPEPVNTPASQVPQAAKAEVDCSADYPQLPLGELPPPVRSEFCKLAADELCYCGCPHTISGCLKEHPACRHAVRMSTLALAYLAGGQADAESTAKYLAGYYDSFKPENRAQLPVEELPCRGPADAKLTLVEFSDFDCPHCKTARPIFEKLVADRHDLRLCFANFPLHKHSALAAAAAVFAQRKGAFWRYHDLLFEDQGARENLDEAAYTDELLRLAGKAGLDQAELKAALADPAILKAVEGQHDLAKKLGFDGTPWVLVNGRSIPPFSAELYQLTFEDELEWAGNDQHWGRD